MKVCLECKKKISMTKRIKSILKNNARLKCDNCKSIFEKEKNSGRLIFSIGTGFSVFISSMIGFELLPTVIESTLLRSIVVGLIAGLVITILATVLTYFTEYEKVE